MSSSRKFVKVPFKVGEGKSVFEMTHEEREALGHVYLGGGRWRCLVVRGDAVLTAKEAEESAPLKESYLYTNTPFTFQNGRSKFAVHKREAGADIGAPEVIEDLACDDGRKAWKNYQVLPDGREGPVIKTKAEFDQYCRLTGQRVRDKGEVHKNPLSERRAKLERHARDRGYSWNP